MWVISLTVITLICKATAQEECVDSGKIYLLGNNYDCSHLLTNTEPLLGIYANRQRYCALEPYVTDCCETCTTVLNCQDDHITIAESQFDCKYLLKYYPEDEKVGIYQHRHSLCRKTTTECCTNCEIVLKQPEPTTTTKVTQKPTTVVTIAPVTEELQDTCSVNCLWYADGAHGTCSWLTDSSSPAFGIRKRLCRQGQARDCARSCQIVMNEAPPTAAIPTTDTSTTEGCTDSEYIRVGRIPYLCTDLVSIQSNIYNDREELCNQATIRGDCCASCDRVDNMKPEGVIRYGENTVIKSSDNIEIVQPAGAAAKTSGQSQDKVIAYNDALKQMQQQQREAEQKVRDIMQQAMHAMFSWFKTINRG